MPIQIFNSLTRQKEAFAPLDPAGKRVLFYACGPTVYGKFHIGNARTFVMTDVVRRWLVKRGHDVQFAMNITDVDDKIIRKANDEGVASEVIAARYTDYFLSMLERLGNMGGVIHPKATQHIPQMVTMIADLVARGHAYATPDGSVWFEVGSFRDYGKLSRMPLDEMKQGERVDAAQQQLKRSPLDFALWKGAKEGEPSWPSPWGNGRPGWHIECSSMSMEALHSQTIDIHSGGSDLRFPHHENEIAQSECATGKRFARYWMHMGMLDIEGMKMSKSLGNVKNIDEVMEFIDPLILRYFFMSAKYGDKIDYTESTIHQCQSAMERMITADQSARRILGTDSPTDWNSDEELQATWNEFAAGMDDDFNSPRALAAIAKSVTLLNTRIANENDKASIARATALLAELREALGISGELVRKNTGGLGDEEIESLIAQRTQAKKDRNFTLADQIRKDLLGKGVQLEDSRTGTIWKRV
ncbi:cysteine--tRNA ligase [Candidatus Sumerlaeota bacterium]|nr:cysteine--tRNA ligase [Candidatus Sumerlaeota bacterium]